MTVTNAGSYLYGAYDKSSAIREDLVDMIANVDPYDTPLMASLSRVQARSTYHEWMTDTLAAADTTGLKEGLDYAAPTQTAPSRVVNQTQIFGRPIAVTNTQRAIDTAGFADAYQYQLEKATKETMRNIEKTLMAAETASTGASATERQMKTLEDFITTTVYNSDDLSGHAVAATNCPNVFTALDVNAILNDIWTAGGNTDLIVLGGAYKRQFSAFSAATGGVAGNNTRNVLATDKKLVVAIDVYDSDFGIIPLMLNRWSPTATNTATATACAAGIADVSGRVWFLERAKVRLAYLRPFHHFLMGTRGDLVAGMVRAELTLEVGNEKSCGVIKGANNKSSVS